MINIFTPLSQAQGAFQLGIRNYELGIKQLNANLKIRQFILDKIHIFLAVRFQFSIFNSQLITQRATEFLFSYLSNKENHKGILPKAKLNPVNFFQLGIRNYELGINSQAQGPFLKSSPPLLSLKDVAQRQSFSIFNSQFSINETSCGNKIFHLSEIFFRPDENLFPT